MVKKHTSRVNRIRILEYMVREGKPVKFRRKIIGYGLRGTDFEKTEKDNIESPSRDIFNDYCDELWKAKHIAKLKQTDKREQYYTITPLGICYLIWSNNELPTSTSQILRILLTSYNHKMIKSNLLPKIKLDDSILNIIQKRHLENNNIFCEVIQNNIIFLGTHIENPVPKSHQRTAVSISRNISTNLKLNLAELEITSFTYVVLFENNLNIEKSFKCNLSLEEFYSYMSLFMLILFFYKIHGIDNPTEFLLDLVEWKTKIKNNPMFQIIHSLESHVIEQMKLVRDDLELTSELIKK